jgi:hypothetical protein
MMSAVLGEVWRADAQWWGGRAGCETGSGMVVVACDAKGVETGWNCSILRLKREYEDGWKLGSGMLCVRRDDEGGSATIGWAYELCVE